MTNLTNQRQCDTQLNTDNNAKNKKLFKVGFIVASVALMLFAMATCAFAAESTTSISSLINSGLGDAYDLFKTIATSVGAIAIVVGGFMFFLGGEKGMQTGKKMILYAFVGIAIVWLAPMLVNTVKGWFDNAGDAGIFS